MPSSLDEAEASAIKVYPVISTTGVWVELPWSKEHFKLYLYNMGGSVVSQKEVPHGGMQFLEITNVPSGLYFLQIESTKGEPEVRKIYVR